MMQRVRDWATPALGCIALVLAAISASANRPPFGDSDTLTRVAYLDWAGWGGILNPLFLRDGAPGGMLLEWTLPFNAFAFLLGRTVGWETASWLAGSLSLAALAAAAMLAARQLGRGAWPLVPSILSFMPICLAYAQWGRINHHAMTAAICLLAVALALRWWRKPGVVGAAAAGAAASLALWQSMESVPMVLAGWGVCIAAVAGWPQRMKGAYGYGLGAAAVLIPALAIDGPWPLFHAIELHRLSLAHALLMTACAVAIVVARIAVLHLPRECGITRRLVTAAMVSLIPMVVAAAVIVWLHPKTEHGPLFDSYFWSPIGELLNLVTGTSLVITALSIPIVVLLSWFIAVTRHPSTMRVMLALVLGGSILMGCCYLRLSIHAESLSLAIGAAMLAGLLNGRLNARTGQMLTIGLSVFAVCVNLAALAAPVAARDEPSCLASREWGAWLENSLPAEAIIMGDLWISPSILATTQRVRTVAGPYHGNPDGVEDVANFMTTTDEQAALSILRRRGASAVVLCVAPWHAQAAPWPPGSMGRRMADGQPPPWLVAIPKQPLGGLAAFSVEIPKLP